jgi:hypothetical protein
MADLLCGSEEVLAQPGQVGFINQFRGLAPVLASARSPFAA